MAPDAHAQATLAPWTPSAPDGGRARPMTLMRTARASWEPAEADPPLAPGAVVDGRYRVVGLVGEGGMGRVYETEHLFLGRRLALKLVRRDAGTGEAAARLLQEAVLAGKVPHATVVPVFDCAALPDGQVYVAMELLRGESLEAALLRPLPAAAALRWLADVARGLAAAHRAGIVHRDVKPANVFLAQTGEGAVQPRILDFGIAKLLPGLAGEAAAGVQTQAGALLGTPFYMAPERIRGETGDGRADLYSLGVILYEALTGEVPFVGGGFMEIVGRHLREAPFDPRQAAPGRQIPDALAELTLALLRKDPATRPGDGDAVADALIAVCEGEPAAVTALTLGAGAGAAAAPAGAPTQAIVEASTQRLEAGLAAGPAAGEVVGDAQARAGSSGHVETDMSVQEVPIGHGLRDMSSARRARPGGWLRSPGLVAAFAVAGGVVAWAALARIDEARPDPAPVSAPRPESGPVGSPGPGSGHAGAPGGVAGAPAAERVEQGSPASGAAERGASGPGEQGSPGTDELPVGEGVDGGLAVGRAVAGSRDRGAPGAGRRRAGGDADEEAGQESAAQSWYNRSGPGRVGAERSRPMSTTSKTAGRSAAARALVVALGVLLARPAGAAPGGGAEAPATVEAALAAGDLETARTLAEQARVADPSPASWKREAEVCARLADLACARAAWQGHLDALPKGADRAPAEAELRALEDMSRGTVADEAPSSHRAELDRARAEREAALRPAPPPAEAPKPAPPKRERIVKKWYFWVTTIAIAAAAGAITGIAVQAARDERADDLDERLRVPAGPPPPPQGFGLRF